MSQLFNYWTLCEQLLADGLGNAELLDCIDAMDSIKRYNKLDDDLQFVTNELWDAFERDMSKIR